MIVVYENLGFVVFGGKLELLLGFFRVELMGESGAKPRHVRFNASHLLGGHRVKEQTLGVGLDEIFLPFCNCGVLILASVPPLLGETAFDVSNETHLL